MEAIGRLTLRQLTDIAALPLMRWLRFPVGGRQTKIVALRDWYRRTECLLYTCPRSRETTDNRKADAACVCRAETPETQIRACRRQLTRLISVGIDDRKRVRSEASRRAHRSRVARQAQVTDDANRVQLLRWRTLADAIESLRGAIVQMFIVTHVGDHPPRVVNGPRGAVPEYRSYPISTFAKWVSCTSFDGTTSDTLPNDLCATLDVDLIRPLQMKRLDVPFGIDDLRNHDVYRVMAVQPSKIDHIVQRLRFRVVPQSAALVCLQPWILEARVSAYPTVITAALEPSLPRIFCQEIVDYLMY